ncbi:MAG: queuosine precursor transporter [Ignavibacteriales bacterium]|nr:queuosine precursor transporter [Ignavibacteriales bacterium]
MDPAFNTIFGQGHCNIAGSLIYFLVRKLVDITAFHYVKSKTGEAKFWLRAAGYTLVTQLIDSFIVLFIAFYIGAGWDIKLVLAIGIENYI